MDNALLAVSYVLFFLAGATGKNAVNHKDRRSLTIAALELIIAGLLLYIAR